MKIRIWKTSSKFIFTEQMLKAKKTRNVLVSKAKRGEGSETVTLPLCVRQLG